MAGRGSQWPMPAVSHQVGLDKAEQNKRLHRRSAHELTRIEVGEGCLDDDVDKQGIERGPKRCVAGPPPKAQMEQNGQNEGRNDPP